MKTKQTKQLEMMLLKKSKENGQFACLEVTLGFPHNKIVPGIERIDCISIDTRDIVRCYEIKQSKTDYKSDAAHTFVGNYNYYAMPKVLYQELKGCIDHEIGIITENGDIIKKAKYREVDPTLLSAVKTSMIRSLYRDAQKVYESEDVKHIEKLKLKINQLEREVKSEKRSYFSLSQDLMLLKIAVREKGLNPIELLEEKMNKGE